MKPVIAIVGHPNVGKSTLFNRLTRSRDALVADQPGLTRDRQFGEGRVGECPYYIVDTGGLGEDDDDISSKIGEQALLAASEADSILFVVDGRGGLSGADQQIAVALRRMGKPIQLLVNKAEGMNEASICAEFHSLGLGEPIAISSAHGDNVANVMDKILASFPETDENDVEEKDGQPGGIRIAVLGRPNVGKSTLVNRMIGEERVLTYDMAGTTRDSISIPFERDGQEYTLIDTAGIRRRGKVSEAIEKFSIIKALQAIEKAHVVILVIDARDSVTEQDTSLLGMVLNAGRGIVLALNKWDGMDPYDRDRAKHDLERRMRFIDYADIHFISALHGSGVGKLFKSVRTAHRSAFTEATTAELTALLENAVEAHQPPMVKGRRIKLRYAHMGGLNPPKIVIHGNQTRNLPDSYSRYLEKMYRKALKMHGTPIQIILKTGDNPFRDQPNKRSVAYKAANKPQTHKKKR